MIKNDFDDEAIKFYKHFYDKNLISAPNSIYKYHNKKVEIDVHGDVCFNILIKKDNNRYTLLGSTIKDSIDEKVLVNLNDKLKELLFSPMNISIMPIKGGLNNIKFYFGCDRFDSFAWLLDLYYKGSKTLILNAGTMNSYIEPRKELAQFLDSYNSVHHYFNDIYGIDNKFVDELIKSGKKEIQTMTEFYSYLNLAISFWKKRLSQEKLCQYLGNERVDDYLSILDELTKIITPYNTATTRT